MKELEIYTKAWKRQMWEAKSLGKWKAPKDRKFIFHKGWHSLPPKHPILMVESIFKQQWFSLYNVARLAAYFCSILTGAGKPAKAVATRLGHKGEKMLQATYSHVTRSMSKQAA